MRLDKSCALLVIDIQQEDFRHLNKNDEHNPLWKSIYNAKKVLDVF